MENELLFTPDQHAVVGHLFAVALGAHVVGFLYFLSARERLAPRYRMATVLSMAVMAASGLLFLRLANSWDTAFVQQGAAMVPTGNRFDGGLRYVNWLVTVPVLLLQVQRAYFQCARSLMRSRLWEPDAWPGRGDLAPMREVFRDHCRLPAPLPPDDVMREDLSRGL